MNSKPSIITVSGGEEISGTNRFLTNVITVPRYQSHDHRMRDSNAVIVDNKVLSFPFHRFPPEDQCRPQLVRFEECVSAEDIEKRFKAVGLVPAALSELLGFLACYEDLFKGEKIGALGSSDQHEIVYEAARQKNMLGLGVRILVQLGILKKGSPPMPSFAYAQIGVEGKNHVMSIQETDAEFKNLLFLGVYQRVAGDEELVDLHIELSEYWKLPLSTSLVAGDSRWKEIGFKYRAKDGHVCEVIKGAGMFDRQWNTMTELDIGIKRYRPVFI